MSNISATLSALKEQGKKALVTFITAGDPNLETSENIVHKLIESGVDMIELGFPFSDPMADGPTIQLASERALESGTTLRGILDMVARVRQHSNTPIILMGYFNPVLQYGVEAFCRKCREVGIDGLILPDLPLEIYERDYKNLIEPYGLSMAFLISPQTSEARVRRIDQASTSFIYMVSSASTTGVQDGFGKGQEGYFRRIEAMGLEHPQIVGFGISDAKSFQTATERAKGAIIGSAFVRMLDREGIGGIEAFIRNIRP